MTFFCNAHTGILGFLSQSFCGLIRIYQTDAKELTYLVYARAPNIFPLEFHRDLSLVLFCLAYTIHNLINHNINHHLYADDTQVYISLSPTDTDTSMSTVNDCLTDILWMESSKYKLNIDKTDIIIIGTI